MLLGFKTCQVVGRMLILTLHFVQCETLRFILYVSVWSWLGVRSMDLGKSTGYGWAKSIIQVANPKPTSHTLLYLHVLTLLVFVIWSFRDLQTTMILYTSVIERTRTSEVSNCSFDINFTVPVYTLYIICIFRNLYFKMLNYEFGREKFECSPSEDSD